MTIFRHEWYRGRISFALWTGVIGFMLVLCLMIYPEMKGEMESINLIFSSLGSFTAMFGMDKVNFGDAMGFYGIECGNILGIGGALFAAQLGISALAGEEKNHTAEFLLTHPVSRKQIVFEKLLSVLTQIAVMNLILTVLSSICFGIIGEKPDWKSFFLMHTAFLVLQFEIGAICFCISSFVRKSEFGIGVGLACLLYFLNIIANLGSSMSFLKYMTPFGYADASDIIFSSSLNGGMMLLWLLITAVCIAFAFLYYERKDLY